MTDLAQCVINCLIVAILSASFLIWCCCRINSPFSRDEEERKAEWDRANREV